MLPELRKASTIFRRLASFLCLMSEFGVRHLGAQRHLELLEVEPLEQLADRLGADHGGEGILAEFVLRLQVLVFRQQLTVLQRGQARLEHDVVLEVQDALEILQRHVEQQADARRQRLQEPDVGDGRGQLDMAHALAPDARQRDFDRALLADDALVLHPLVLAAQALVVLDRPEDARAEQAVALGLEGTVVDGLRLLDLAVGPGQNLLGRCDRDPDLVEDLSRRRRIEKIHNFLVHRLLLACRSSPAANSKIFFTQHPALHLGTGAMPGRQRPGIEHRVTRPPPRRALAHLGIVQVDVEAERAHFLDQHVEGLGIPASNVSSPRTIASYTLVRPATSSDFTVSISCSV